MGILGRWGERAGSSLCVVLDGESQVWHPDLIQHIIGTIFSILKFCCLLHILTGVVG